jgi:hypothetical protein
VPPAVIGANSRFACRPVTRPPSAVQNTSCAIASVCFAKTTSSAKTPGARTATMSRSASKAVPKRRSVAESRRRCSTRAASRAARKLVPTSSNELARKTIGRRSTPTRFKKNVSATLVADTDAHSTRNKAAAPTTSTRSSPGSMSSPRRTRSAKAATARL